MTNKCEPNLRSGQTSAGWVRAPSLKWPLSLLLLTLYGTALAADHELSSYVTEQQTDARERVAGRAEVSLVTVEPNEVRLADETGEAVATVTVQIFHSSLTKDETVMLSVSNYSTNPPGIAVSYEPPSQTVRLPPGGDGVVVATVSISKLSIGDNKQARVVIIARLTKPSSGIKVVDADPGLPNHLANLTIERK